MGLRMKDFNIFGVHWKIRFLGEGFTKNQYDDKITAFAISSHFAVKLKKKLIKEEDDKGLT